MNGLCEELKRKKNLNFFFFPITHLLFFHSRNVYHLPRFLRNLGAFPPKVHRHNFPFSTGGAGCWRTRTGYHSVNPPASVWLQTALHWFYHRSEWPTRRRVCGRRTASLGELHVGHRTRKKSFFFPLSRNHDPVTRYIPQTLSWAVSHVKYTVTPFHPSIYPSIHLEKNIFSANRIQVTNSGTLNPSHFCLSLTLSHTSTSPAPSVENQSHSQTSLPGTPMDHAILLQWTPGHFPAPSAASFTPHKCQSALSSL